MHLEADKDGMTAFPNLHEASKRRMRSLAPKLGGAAIARAILTTISRANLNEAIFAYLLTSAARQGYLSVVRGLYNRISLHFSLYFFRYAHTAITLLIWQHFFYLKLQQRTAVLPNPEAPNYWLKLLVPPVEFGAMHAILFQIALVPLTMSKNLLSKASTASPLASVFPFEHVVSFHIFVGYLFCIIMILSVILFVVFFGKVCGDHQEGRDPANLCLKFSSEIMGTGWGIFGTTLIVLTSSYFRHKLRFATFYKFHMMVFCMYILAVVHTLDKEFRNGTKAGKRSQTFIWFSTSLCLFLADRAWSVNATNYSAQVTLIEKSDDSSTLVLHLERPVHYNFVPGQYALLQVPAIDSSWHPFSIGSDPESSSLTFFIQVMGVGTWTRALANSFLLDKIASEQAGVHLRGPFGYPVAGASDIPPDTVIAVGTGTGIVPFFSMIAARARQMKLLTPGALWQDEQQVVQNICAHKARRVQAVIKKDAKLQAPMPVKKTVESMRRHRHHIYARRVFHAVFAPYAFPSTRQCIPPSPHPSTSLASLCSLEQPDVVAVPSAGDIKSAARTDQSKQRVLMGLSCACGCRRSRDGHDHLSTGPVSTALIAEAARRKRDEAHAAAQCAVRDSPLRGDNALVAPRQF